MSSIVSYLLFTGTLAWKYSDMNEKSTFDISSRSAICLKVSGEELCRSAESESA